MRPNKINKSLSHYELENEIKEVFTSAQKKVNHHPIKNFYIRVHLKILGFSKKETKKYISWFEVLKNNNLIQI